MEERGAMITSRKHRITPNTVKGVLALSVLSFLLVLFLVHAYIIEEVSATKMTANQVSTPPLNYMAKNLCSLCPL